MSSRAITLLSVRFDTAPGGKGPAHEWTSVFRCIIGNLQWINRKIAQPMGGSTKIRGPCVQGEVATPDLLGMASDPLFRNDDAAVFTLQDAHVQCVFIAGRCRHQ